MPRKEEGCKDPGKEFFAMEEPRSYAGREPGEPPRRRSTSDTPRRRAASGERRRQNGGPGEQPPRRSGGRRRRRGGSVAAAGAVLYVVAVIGVSVFLAAVGWICAGDVLALNKTPHSAEVVLPQEFFTQREVTVKGEDGKPDTTRTEYVADIGKVAKCLKEEGFIEYKPVFKLFCAVTKAKTKMAPGTYQLNTDMDYRALISALGVKSGSKAEISVTIPEGYSVEQIFTLLEEKGVASVKDLNDMAANHDYKFEFLEDIPLGDPKRLEGYLFPDTYRFYINENPLYAINKMLVNFSQMVSKEQREELKEEGKSLRDIITIASMIEKETDGTDQAMISSVIYNRLNHPNADTNGYLQIDATLVYINGGNQPTEADKTIDSPYNTYLYAGLPAGPISNPGSEAIWAAMNPKSSDYYYYALGTDGLHHYSRTYHEHQAFLNSLPKE